MLSLHLFIEMSVGFLSVIFDFIYIYTYTKPARDGGKTIRHYSSISDANNFISIVISFDENS